MIWHEDERRARQERHERALAQASRIQQVMGQLLQDLRDVRGRAVELGVTP